MQTLVDVSPHIGQLSRPLLIVFVLVGLAIGLRRTGLAKPAKLIVWLAIAVPLMGWFALMTWIGQTELYQAFPWSRRAAVLLPPLIWLPLLMRSNRFTTLIDVVPPAWLIGIQVYRVLGCVFLIQWGAGRVPGLFALPAGMATC